MPVGGIPVKKICFFTYNLFDLGGIQRVVTVLASALCAEFEVYIQCYDEPQKENRALYNLDSHVKVIFAKRDNRKSTVRKILRKLNQKYALIEKINCSQLFEYAYILPEEQKLYKRIIEENDIDIAIAVGAFESYILGSIANQVQAKTVGWQHNSYKAYYETPGMACWGMGYIVEKYFPKLDRYIVLNEYDQEEFLKKKNFECLTIHNPKSFVSNKQAELKNKRFIAAGHFIYAKAFDLLIESFSEFAKKNKEWELVIYGTGEGYDTIKTRIEKLELTDRIKLPGFSDHMTENLLESSCYLLSSRWEGMPMVILEALEIGLPIISYDISAMIPLVENGVEGIVVPQFDTSAFAQAMLEIAESEEMRVRMGKASREKASQFTVEKITEQWFQLLREL